MTEPTETRQSLLIRLRDGQCERAWDEFAEIYRPMVVRLARQSGLQDCDADDVAQRVLMSVVRTIGSWQKDPSKGRFRGWLTTVTKNAIRNAVTRTTRDQLVGSTELFGLLEDANGDQSELDRHIEAEFMRAVFRAAADRARGEFSESTWEAFWLTTIGDTSVTEAAQELQTTCGAIYATRSRVMRRLQQITQEILSENERS